MRTRQFFYWLEAVCLYWGNILQRLAAWSAWQARRRNPLADLERFDSNSER